MDHPSTERRGWGGLLGPAFMAGVVVATLLLMLLFPLLLQERKNALWRTLADHTDPAQATVAEVTSSLAREMASLRAYVLTGRVRHRVRFEEAREREREAFEALLPMIADLGSDVLDRYAQLEGLLHEWHGRPTEVEMLAGVLEPETYLARIEEEQPRWEGLLATAGELRAAISEAEGELRDEIARLEALRARVMGLLGLLALLAAGVTVELTRRVQRLRVQAERGEARVRGLMKGKTRLMEGLTHDLRNPLSAIHGYSELLAAEDAGLALEDRPWAAERIRRLTKETLELVDDLLQLAMAEAGELLIEPRNVDLAGELRAAYEEYGAAAEAAGLTGSLELGEGVPPVVTDPKRLRQIVGNLLSNAIKYTPPGGRVTLRAEADSPDVVQIEVSDDGPGIPAHQHETIFEEFSRLDPSNTRGAGLGLAMSRTVANLLGAELEVDSRAGAGATFRLRLPVTAPPERCPPPPDGKV